MKSKQSTDTLLMIRPVKFRMNEQTAVNNYYQKFIEGLSADQVQKNALKEFDDFVETLRENGLSVIVIDDSVDPDTPDSIFPNNWISLHNDGKIGLYPMFAENRRLERRKDIIEKLKATFEVKEVIDLSHFESDNKFLEGTGSMILDRPNKLCYTAVSERTQMDVLKEFSDKFKYEIVPFVANQTVGKDRLPIYHTNVMMCVADEFAILCADSIDDDNQRRTVIDKLEGTGKEVIEISEKQKHHFAGNMLQVRTEEGRPYLVMSESAYQSLNHTQIERIVKHCPIIHSSLDTIEALGGGSARCMMAEVFLPKKK